MSITRRLFLRNTAAAGAVAATVAAPAIVEAATISPRQRLDEAIAELKAAAEAIWPDATDCGVQISGNRHMPLVVRIATPIGTSMLEPFRNAKPGAV